MSSACVVTAMMWFKSRVISPNRTAKRRRQGGADSSPGQRWSLHTRPRPGPWGGGGATHEAEGEGGACKPRERARCTSDPLRPRRRLDVQQFLHSQRVGLLIAHHGHVVQPVEVGKGLGRGRNQVPLRASSPCGAGWTPNHQQCAGEGTLSHVCQCPG